MSTLERKEMKKLIYGLVWLYIKYGMHPKIRKNTITKIRKS